MKKLETLEVALLGLAAQNGTLILTGEAPQWRTTVICVALSFSICLYRSMRRRHE